MTTKTFGNRTGADYAGFECNYLNSGAPTTNYVGTYPRISNSTAICHSTYKWTGIPTSGWGGSVTVNSVTLSVYSESLLDVMNLQWFRLLVDNIAAQSTWNNAKTGVPWSAGGAYNATDAEIGTQITSITTTSTGYVEFVFPSTSAFCTLVAGWMNGTIPNYGILGTGNPESGGSGTFDFFGPADAADFSPQLTIDYTAGGGGATISTITGTTVTEASSIVFTATMSGTGGGTFAYSWSGTATSADYTSTLTTGMCAVTGGSGSVTVSGSNITVDSTVTAFTVTVPTTTDTLDEANETIRLVIGGVTSSSGTITDDDAAPTITGTASSTVTAGDPVVITYSPGLSGQTRTYTLALTDGTAVGGTDYDNTTVTGDFAVTAGTGSVSISGSTVTVDAGVTEFTLTITTTA